MCPVGSLKESPLFLTHSDPQITPSQPGPPLKTPASIHPAPRLASLCLVEGGPLGNLLQKWPFWDGLLPFHIFMGFLLVGWLV